MTRVAYAIGSLLYVEEEGAVMITSVYTASESADSLTIDDRRDYCRVTLASAEGSDYEDALVNLLFEVGERGRVLGKTWRRLNESLCEQVATALPDIWDTFCARKPPR